jgi:ribokinase
MPERADVWVLGNLTLDDLVFPDGTTAMHACGGNAIFAALGARLWSNRVGLSARIGPDYPRQYLGALAGAGIDLRLSPVEARSMHNWALYESLDVRRFITWLDSGSHLDQSLLADEVPPAAGAAQVCHVAPMPLVVQQQLVQHLAPRPPDGVESQRRSAGAMQCEPTEQLADPHRAAPAGRTLVSLDPHDEYIRGSETVLLDLLPRVDLFLPSRHEAALLFGQDVPEDAARAFVAHGAKVAAIKLGAEGSLVFAAELEQPLHVPALDVRAVDPTGAGDAYCGAFGAVYARTRRLLDAALRATVAASFVVEHYGAMDVLPLDTLAANARLARLEALVHHTELHPQKERSIAHAHG